MPLSINRSIKSPGVIVLKIGGSLDANTSSRLEEEINDLLQTSPRSLIFDFEFLDFISSAGIRVILMAQKELLKRGASIMMVKLQPQIQKVFDIIKALPNATIFRNVEELDSYLAGMQQKFRE
jgi:anti-anti-sigma factor